MSKYQKEGFHYTGVRERIISKTPDGEFVTYIPRYVRVEVKEKQEPTLWPKRLKKPGNAFMKATPENLLKRPYKRREHKSNREAKLAANGTA